MSKAWMPMYWGDYLADTGHLTMAQHGAYLLLIAHYWQNGGLPTDTRQLQRIAKCPNNYWKKTWEALQPFFSLQVNKFGSLQVKHKRLDAELEKALTISLKRKVYGTKGGFASRGKTNQQRNYDKAFAKQMGDQSQSHSKITSFLTAARERKRSAEEEE